jgi:hypothetical protein
VLACADLEEALPGQAGRTLYLDSRLYPQATTLSCRRARRPRSMRESFLGATGKPSPVLRHRSVLLRDAGNRSTPTRVK